MYWSGTAAVYQRLRPADGALVLMYHSVAPAECAAHIDPSVRLPAQMFQRQMRFLARHRRVISITDLVETLRSGQSPEGGTVVITFDDGYLDTLETAAPILASLDLPAVVYLPTGFMAEEESMWVDRLYSAFTRRTRHELALEIESPATFDLNQPDNVRAAYRRIADALIAAVVDRRDAMLSEIEQQLRPEGEVPRLMMTWDDVRRLVRDYPNIEIGGHTVNHVDLTAVDGVSLDAEINGCLDDLRRETETDVRHFSYPYSRHNEQARASVRQAGIDSAVVGGESVRATADTDPMRLPRIAAPSSMTLLRFWTSGAYPGLPRMVLGR